MLKRHKYVVTSENAPLLTNKKYYCYNIFTAIFQMRVDRASKSPSVSVKPVILCL